MLVSISGAVRLKGRETLENEPHERRPRTSITSATKRLPPERHPQASGPLASVYRKPGRLCLKVTISVLENNSTFWFYLQIIIQIFPRPVQYRQLLDRVISVVLKLVKMDSVVLFLSFSL
jgi:hypothetical protein